MATTEATPAAITKHMESTIDLIDEHVKKESVTGVSNAISSWIKTLEDHKEFKGIAADLEELKTAVSEKNGKQIVSLMTKLGAETTKVADKAEEGQSMKIKGLGKALSAAAKALGKFAK
ncbi:MAG: hypothetical protein ABIQ31_21850 [Ferruginibacter sp.]